MDDDTNTAEAGNETITAEAGNDTFTDPAGSVPATVTEAPRNELQDSIDPGTGALTEEAVALRAQHGITQAGETLPEGDVD